MNTYVNTNYIACHLCASIDRVAEVLHYDKSSPKGKALSGKGRRMWFKKKEVDEWLTSRPLDAGMIDIVLAKNFLFRG